MSVNESNTFSYKRAFKDYITEFVMLFAAVTLGFLLRTSERDMLK